MVTKAGTLLFVNYTAKLKGTEEVIDTTVEGDAKKSGSHDPSRKYEPRLVAVGEGWVLKGVDEALGSANVMDNLTIDVQPDKGFGERDPNKVKMIPIRRFGERANELRIGDEVQVEDRKGTVRLIGSGRAQVDFNHRYAGKALTYQLEIVQTLESDPEKAIALIRRRLPIEGDKLKVAIVEDSASIELPEEMYMLEGLQIIKRAIANDLFKYLKTIRRASFAEIYEQPRSRVEAKVEEKVEAKVASANIRPSTPEGVSARKP